MSGELLLGLDLGTTSCKAAVVTPEGDELAHGRARVPWEVVPSGAEIAPRSLLGAALAESGDAGGMELRRLNDDRVELVGIGQEPSPALVWRAALESVGRGARDILDRMDRAAGSPRARLVVAGGWAEGEAARAVKQAHLGAFEQSEAIYMGARGAALAAGRAAGLL